MAAATAAARAPLRLPWAVLLLLAALLHSGSPAAPEKEVPNKPLRVRIRSSDKLSARWKLPQSSGFRSPRRSQGYPWGYGESSRKMTYVPLQKHEQGLEAKKLASESVYMVSLQSRNSQGQSQPVYRAALTKRKISEEDELEEAKDISVRVMSSQSVLVAWTDPIYEKQKKVVAARQYSVRYREKGESARWDYKQVSNRRVLVDKLIPDTMYEFAVRISEGEREGKWSASVYQRTPEAAPASAPENLDVWLVKGKTTSVTASWDPLAESEGKVKEYILSYAPALKPFGAKSITYRGDTTSAIIDGLQPGERYIFKIRAANRRGQGPQSKAFSVVMPTASRDDSDVHQQTKIQDTMESKKPGDAVPSSPPRTTSVLSKKIQPSASSKHTAVHSSSSPSGGDTKNPLPEFKNKLLTGSGVLNKSQLSSKKTSEQESDPQSTEVTDDHDSSNETPKPLPKTQDQRKNIRPHSASRPFHSVLSSGRTPVRTRTLVRTRQTSTDKHGSSSPSLIQRSSSSSFASSPIPKYTDNETKRQRQDNSNIPSSPKIPLDNLPADNVPHDLAGSVEEKQIILDSVPLKRQGSSQVSSKTPEHTHLALPLNRQSAVSHKEVQSHQSKPHTSLVPIKLPTSSTVTNSQSHSRYPSSKLVHSGTRDSYDHYDSKEVEGRNERSSYRSSHDGDSLPSLQTKLPSGSNPQILKDPKLTMAAVSSKSAVSASASHTLTHSRVPPSAKHRSDGRDVDDDNYSEDTETEGEKKRQDSSSSRFNSRSSLGQTASERFNLLKHKAFHTTNKFLNRVSNNQEPKIQPSKSPYSAVSSKVRPQSNAHLTSTSARRSSFNIDRDARELEGEDEKPLPSTIAHDHSPSSSRQSSSTAVYTRRRSPSVESSTRRREPLKEKSQLSGSEDELSTEIEETPTKSGSLLTVRQSSSLPSISGRSPSSTRTNHHPSPSVSHQVTNGQDARSRALSGSSSSTGSSSVATAEKYSLGQSSASKQQPDDQDGKEVKETTKSKQSMPLSKKTLNGGSRFSSQKALHSEPSPSQKGHAGQSQLQLSLLNSRDWLPSQISPQSNKKLQEDEDVAEEQEADDRIHAHSAFPKDVSSRRISTSLSQGNSSSSLSQHQQSGSQISKVDEKHKSRHDSLTPSRGSSSFLPAGRHIGSKVAISKPAHSGSSSISDTAKDNRDTSLLSKSSSTSLRQTHPSVPNYHSGSRVPTRTASKSEKKYGPFQSTPSKVEPSLKAPFSSLSKSHQSVSKEDDDDATNNEHDQGEVEEKPTLSSSARWSSSSNSRDSKNMNGNGARDKRKPAGSHLIHRVNSAEEKDEEEEPPTLKQSLPASQGRLSSSVVSRVSQSPNKPHISSKPRLAWPRSSASISVPSQMYPTHSTPPTLPSSSSPLFPRQRLQNSRLRNLSQRQFVRPPYRQGSNGRPNLTTKTNINGKILPGNNGKPSGQRIINGPQGTKWIVDLDRGLVLNVEGRYLQDSQGNPLRVKLGGDGRTIVDAGGAPVVSPDGLPLFGHGRFSKPLASAQDKPIVSLGGKPLIGLEMIKKTTTPSTTMTTIPTTTTTIATTTTTTTTTTPEPTTTEPLTEKPLPTCPPGTDAQYDEEGKLVIGLDGLPECNAEDAFSGLDMDVTATPEAYVIYDEDYEFFESTVPPTTTTMITTTTTTEAVPDRDYPEISVAGSDPVSEFDLVGKKRFTAPYVTYLNKDPAAPCSLTEALEHFQVESLDEIIPYNIKEGELRPQSVPHNITVVAVEGCHSFVIVDWDKPRQGDVVTGYLVYSASYDDFIRNKWSTRTAGATHLPIENLKPNTRYYFKVQAKNPHGYGPISSSVSFVTESDNPLLIVRPPGGEPIWIPFSFKYDPTYSDCSGKQYVKRTWYRKFVGVVLCNSLRYKIYLSDDLKDIFYGIGDSWGRGEDHCQFVDSHMDGRTGPQSYVEALPTIQGYYRQYRQEPVSFGRIGYTTPYYYVGWYECGVPIPGKW
ncbi:fibronectin type III domain-containing protein 1 [Emydura macquarii macquarii]|uniref:fibronectin type III domain-containing protein 1 n=1 Tax=Emydura macquarii macquarii TaxID=1129001 RepID=UPI00352A4302